MLYKRYLGTLAYLHLPADEADTTIIKRSLLYSFFVKALTPSS